MFVSLTDYCYLLYLCIVRILCNILMYLCRVELKRVPTINPVFSRDCNEMRDIWTMSRRFGFTEDFTILYYLPRDREVCCFRTMGQTKVFYEYLNPNNYYRIWMYRHSMYLPIVCSLPNNSAYYIRMFCIVLICRNLQGTA